MKIKINYFSYKKLQVSTNTPIMDSIFWQLYIGTRIIWVLCTLYSYCDIMYINYINDNQLLY